MPKNRYWLIPQDFVNIIIINAAKIMKVVIGFLCQNESVLQPQNLIIKNYEITTLIHPL